MQIQTTRFGPAQIDPKSILNFKSGLLGFESLKRYAVIACDATEPIQWLQAIDDPDVSLPIINPFIIVPDYCVDVDGSELMSIGLPSEEDILMINVMVVPEDIRNTTINLCAPILINIKNNEARQIVMESDRENAIRYPAFAALAEYYQSQEALGKEREGDAGTDEKD